MDPAKRAQLARKLDKKVGTAGFLSPLKWNSGEWAGGPASAKAEREIDRSLKIWNCLNFWREKNYIYFRKEKTTLWCLSQSNEGPLLCLKAVIDQEKLPRQVNNHSNLLLTSIIPGEKTGWNFKQDWLFHWNDAVRKKYPQKFCT